MHRHLLAAFLVPCFFTVLPARAAEPEPPPRTPYWCLGECPARHEPDSPTRLTLVKFNEGRSSLFFQGFLQTRFSQSNDDGSLPEGASVDVFSLHRARFTFGGKLEDWASMKLEVNAWDSINHELSPEEAYFDLTPADALGIRAGLFKAPLMLHRMMSSSRFLFAEDPMVVSQRAVSIKGFDPKKKMNTFPSKDTGVMLFGDLYPFSRAQRGSILPPGFLRYYLAFQNGYDMKKGTGRGDAGMISLRLEINPFGAQPWTEILPQRRGMFAVLGFQYARSVDLEVQDTREKEARLYGVDGLFLWGGLSLAGGWYRQESAYPVSFERERLDANASFDPAWKSQGWYFQAASFVPLAMGGVDWHRHLQVKLRWEEFDPFAMLGGHLYSPDMPEEFIPVGANTPQDRKTRVVTLGLNWFMDVAGIPDGILLSLDYLMRDELEPFRDINDIGPDGKGRLKNVQIRNNTTILQLQLSL